MRAKPTAINWGLRRRGPQGRLLQAVQALWAWWQLGQHQRCLINRPLLAELLQDCGYLYEAAALQQEWELDLDWYSRPTQPVYLIGRERLPWGTFTECRNQHRIFWFPPGSLRLSNGLYCDGKHRVALLEHQGYWSRYSPGYADKNDTEVIHPTRGMLHAFLVPGFEED